MKEKYTIKGMTCSACSGHIEKSVGKVDGVQCVNVNLLQNSMVVTYEDEKISSKEIVHAVESGGYFAMVSGEKKSSEKPENLALEELQEMKFRLLGSFFFLIPLMYVSMGHMMNAPLPELLLGMENTMIFALVQLCFTLPILYMNRKYFIVGFKSLFHGSPNMDSLIALGATASVAYSIFAMFLMAFYMGRGDLVSAHTYAMNLYFESAAMILTLITLGKFMETRSKGKTSEAISKLMDLAPKTATVERNGVEEETAIENIIVGDIIIVRQGQRVPLDGRILEGTSAIDESALTGESIPVEKQAGDIVIGATINKSGYFKMSVTHIGSDTTLAQIIALVEEASASKAPIAQLADKVSSVFVPTVIGVSLLSTIIWLIVGQPLPFALSIGIAVLVISCPCALGLATPTAIMVATGKGAQHGILIKSAESLEIAHKINTVVVDKTGTLTEGKPVVTDVILAKGTLRNSFLRMATSLENLSEHPLATAIVAYGKDLNIPLSTAENFVSTAGQGIQATVDGKLIYGGNLRMMTALNIDLGEFKQKSETLANEGKTPIYFVQDKKFLGILALADTLKETSKDAVDAFHTMGIEVIMLTGDNQRTANAIGEQLGIIALGDVLPQDKEKKVRQLQSEGKKVAMIGDGVNDAPALTRADVGIAIGAGTDVAIESGDIILMKSDLLDAVTAIQLSHATIKNIKQNLFWAFFYNILGIPLAAGLFYPSFGLTLNPMFAAAAMSFSSVFVVGNALRLKLFVPKKYSNKVMIQSEKIEYMEENMMKKTLIIDGMTCGHCSARVENVLNAVEGVKAEVNLEEKSATITLSKDIEDDILVQVITEAGYEVVDIL